MQAGFARLDDRLDRLQADMQADFEAKVRGDNESVSARRPGFIG